MRKPIVGASVHSRIPLRGRTRSNADTRRSYEKQTWAPCGPVEALSRVDARLVGERGDTSSRGISPSAPNCSKRE